MKKYLKFIHDLLRTVNKETLTKSLRDVHAKGLFSLVLNGTENGKLLRVFIATNKIKPFDIQLHSHRYTIRLTVLKGTVTHFVAEKSEKTIHSVLLDKFSYKSPLNGGDGLNYIGSENMVISNQIIPISGQIDMKSNEIHTVSCSKDSIWIVEELGFETESSIVYGSPFVTEGLYQEPYDYQINDNHQLVKKTVSLLLQHYPI